MTLRLKSKMLAFGFVAGLVLTTSLGAAYVMTAQPTIGPWTLDPSNPEVTLEEVEREVIRHFRVNDITSAKLVSMLANGQVNLFDVRTRDEYEAGHLPGAIRIEPGTSAEAILREHKDKLGSRPSVFYCAVGVRSSKILASTLRDLAPHSKSTVYNLRGGVFRWTADGRALVSGDEPGMTHPYDEKWGQLLKRTVSGR
jgi:rhodanese-related sulfurtransferase